jgi:transposase-like protein
MVLPLLAAAIGAGGSIAGGLIGARSQDKANEQNYQIALLNYYNQIEQQRQAQAEAHRQDAESKLGSTDAEGNTVKFVPGVGWVQTRSAKGEEYAGELRKEELAQLQDLKNKREQAYKVQGRKGRQGNMSDALYEAYARNYRRDPSSLIGRKNLMATEASNEGFDEAMRQAMVDNIRTGGGNQAKIASQFGRDKFNSLRKAFQENEIGAVEGEENRYMQEQGNILNMANSLAQQAGEPFDAPFNPRSQDITSGLQSAMGQGAGTASRLQSAFSQQYPDFNFQHEPNMGIPNTIAQATQIAAGGINLYDATRNPGQTSYANYAGGGSQGRNYFPPAPGYSNSGVAANMYNKGTGPWGMG